MNYEFIKMTAFRTYTDYLKTELNISKYLTIVIGVIIGIGTMRTNTAADVALLLLAFGCIGWYWSKHGFSTLFPVWLLPIMFLLVTSIIITVSPERTVTFAVRIINLLVLTRIIYLESTPDTRKYLTLGFILAILPQTIVIAINGIDTFRPNGYSVNSSQTGETGMVLFWIAPTNMLSVLVSSFTVGAAGARQAIIGVWSFTIFSKNWYVFGTALIVTFYFLTYGIVQRDHPFEDLGRHFASRTQIISNNIPQVAQAIDKVVPTTYKSTSYPPTGDKPPEITPQIRPFGYGLGAYVPATGGARPHNVYLLVLYDLGILSVIPILYVGFLIYKRLLSPAIWISLAGLFFITEEWIGRPEGYYMLALIITTELLRRKHNDNKHIVTGWFDRPLLRRFPLRFYRCA